MSKYIIIENMLIQKTFTGKKTELPLNALRLVYMFSTQISSWWGLGSRSSLTYVDLNGEENATEELYDALEEAIKGQRRGVLKEFQFALADFQGNSTMLNLAEIDGGPQEFLEKLKRYRKERTALVSRWVDSGGEVVLKGGFGAEAVLRRDGVYFKRKSISWREIREVFLETQESLITVNHLLFIPHGVSDGLFSMKKYKYCLRNIPNAKKHIYVAESNFWQSRAESEPEIKGPITKLNI